jgi:NAD(P)H-flavin reductase
MTTLTTHPPLHPAPAQTSAPRPIKKFTGTVISVRDLSPTAREVTFRLSEPLLFSAGAFVNVYAEKNGTRIRRAYSVSSASTQHDEISVSIRLVPDGAMGVLFWAPEIIGTTFDLMGPLGINTVDSMRRKKIFLFGFGIGAGVVKSIALSLVRDPDLESLTIATGSKHENEILFRDFFETLSASDPRVSFFPVVSGASGSTVEKTGYIQDHISGLDFSGADIFMCGQEAACRALATVIEAQRPADVSFLIEAFH